MPTHISKIRETVLDGKDAASQQKKSAAAQHAMKLVASVREPLPELLQKESFCCNAATD